MDKYRGGGLSLHNSQSYCTATGIKAEWHWQKIVEQNRDPRNRPNKSKQMIIDKRPNGEMIHFSTNGGVTTGH